MKYCILKLFSAVNLCFKSDHHVFLAGGVVVRRRKKPKRTRRRLSMINGHVYDLDVRVVYVLAVFCLARIPLASLKQIE